MNSNNKKIRSDTPEMEADIVEILARNASKAISKLIKKEGRTFWRSTTHKFRSVRVSRTTLFPTVTFRSLESLLIALVERPEWVSDDVKVILTRKMIPFLVDCELDSFESSLTVDTASRLNDFTLSLYLQSFASVCQTQGLDSGIKNKAKRKINEGVNELLRSPVLRINPKISTHPFLLFHILRALLSSKKQINNERLISRIERACGMIISNAQNITETLIAKRHLDALGPSDAVAMAFCAGILALEEKIENREHLVCALRISCESQNHIGCWPLGRLVDENKDLNHSNLEINTNEVGWVVAMAANRLFSMSGIDSESDLAKKVEICLARANQYAEKSIVRTDDGNEIIVGWCGDQPYNVGMVESWASATVLQYACQVKKWIEEFAKQKVLAKFTTLYPNAPQWPKWLNWNDYKIKNEVDHEYPILEYLDENIIKLIQNSDRRLPSPDSRNVSALLFGPPGTSKTTIVKAISDALSWPLVLLNPGNFIEDGLERIEQRAKYVFDQLMRLSRTVVLFDECDELFRDRSPIIETEQTRGIGAFVTASMLPKLQELHDSGRIVFVICTNNFESIDSAVIRGGRIDHLIGIGPPDEKSRKHIIKTAAKKWLTEMNKPRPNHQTVALNELARKTERFTRSELNRATILLLKKANWRNNNAARSAARELAERFKETLIITEDVMESYVDIASRYSNPRMEV